MRNGKTAAPWLQAMIGGVGLLLIAGGFIHAEERIMSGNKPAVRDERTLSRDKAGSDENSRATGTDLKKRDGTTLQEGNVNDGQPSPFKGPKSTVAK